MTIKEISYARLYAMPGYENERFEAIVIVQNGDVDAAFDEAQQQVEAQYARFVARRTPAQPRTEPPASDKQRNYIATLQDQLLWTSEQLAAYAADQRFDLVNMTMRQASDFINGLKRLSEKQSAPAKSTSMSRHIEPPPMDDGDLPF